MCIKLTDKIIHDDHDDVAAAVHKIGKNESNFSVINVIRALTRIGNLQTCGRHE